MRVVGLPPAALDAQAGARQQVLLAAAGTAAVGSAGRGASSGADDVPRQRRLNLARRLKPQAAHAVMDLPHPAKQPRRLGRRPRTARRPRPQPASEREPATTLRRLQPQHAPARHPAPRGPLPQHPHRTHITRAHANWRGSNHRDASWAAPSPTNRLRYPARCLQHRGRATTEWRLLTSRHASELQGLQEHVVPARHARWPHLPPPGGRRDEAVRPVRSAICSEDVAKPASPFCHTDEQREAWVPHRLKMTILVTRNGFSLRG